VTVKVSAARGEAARENRRRRGIRRMTPPLLDITRRGSGAGITASEVGSK
jgi:hypothetical protein